MDYGLEFPVRRCHTLLFVLIAPHSFENLFFKRVMMCPLSVLSCLTGFARVMLLLPKWWVFVAYTPEWMRLKPAESSSPLYCNYTRSLQTNKSSGRLISFDLSAQARLFVDTDNQSWVFLMVVLIQKTASSSFTYMWTTVCVYHVTLYVRAWSMSWFLKSGAEMNSHTSSEFAWRHLKLNILTYFPLNQRPLSSRPDWNVNGPEPDTKSSLLSCQRSFQ